MRFLMTIDIPTEHGNAAIKNGSLPKVIESVLNDIHPEAAYFGPRAGNRAAFVVFDLDDVSLIPSIAEPLFIELGAKVEMIPVMNQDDLATGLGRIHV
jgi:hypothetical protein